MMNKLIKKYISIILVMLITIGVSACGMKGSAVGENNVSEDVESNSASEVSDSVSADVSSVTEKAEEDEQTKPEETPQVQNSEIIHSTATPSPTDEIIETNVVPNPAGSSQESVFIETNIPAPDGSTGYEQYIAMSGEEQEAFYNTFDSTAAFFQWLNAAQAEYEALHPSIDAGNGEIVFGNSDSGN